MNDTGVKYNSPSYEILLNKDGTLTGRSIYLDSGAEICPLRGSWATNGQIILIERWKGQDFEYGGVFNGTVFQGRWKIIQSGMIERRNQGSFAFQLSQTAGFATWNVQAVLYVGKFVGEGVAVSRVGTEYLTPPFAYRFQLQPDGRISGTSSYLESVSGKLDINCPLQGM